MHAMASTQAPRSTTHATHEVDAKKLRIGIVNPFNLYRGLRLHFEDLRSMDVLLPPLLQIAGAYVKPIHLLGMIRRILIKLRGGRPADRAWTHAQGRLILSAVLLDNAIYDVLIRRLDAPQRRLRPGETRGNA